MNSLNGEEVVLLCAVAAHLGCVDLFLLRYVNAMSVWKLEELDGIPSVRWIVEQVHEPDRLRGYLSCW